jgi:VCBS repeat-containing protein
MEVTQVEYRLDGGDWLPATQDGDAWLFYYLPADQGQQTIDLRATDTLGNVGTENRTLTLDDTPPNVTLGTADLICDATFCMLTLDGTVTDAGSGVEAVYIDIIEPGGRSLILSGNAAYLQGDQWSLILEPMLYPSNDTFTVILTAVDKVGNYIETIDDSSRSNSGGQPDHTLHLDITPPIADLTDMGVPGGYTDTLAGTAANLPVISGTITDIPYPLSTLIQMHFEEPVGAMGFHDGTSRRTIGTCSGVSCPIAGGSGKYGRGLTFESGDVVDLGMQPVIDGAADNFTAMAWIYLNDTIGVKTIIDADTTNSLDGFGFSVVDAGLRVDAYGVHVYDSTKITLPTNEWVHVAAAMDHVADGSAYAVLFYVNGLPVDYATHAVPPILNKDDPIQIGAGFVGMLDEVYLFNIVPTPAMIKDIARPVSLGVNKLEVGLLHVKDWGNLDKVSWGTASLNAPGEIFSTWSYTLPTNLEGEYQIYLRTTDELPRSQILPSVWQGQIDTHPPRAELRYTPPRFPGDWHLLQCWVEDFNLTEQGYDCPVPGSLPESYEESWYTSVIPTQKLHRFVSPATSLHSFSPLETMTAYDSHGAKTIVSATISNQNWLLGTAILTPTARSTANPLQAVLIEGAAYAQASLKTITVTANTVPVYTENWTAGAVNQKAWTAVFTPTQEGGYTVLAEAQDWAGGVITSSAPVAGMVAPQTIVYVDAADPLITITTTHVTAANFDINGFVGVSGLLTETNEVRSLEVKLETPTQTGMWETIPLSDTTALVGAPWQARVYAGSPTPPKGETYTITARVTDVVGKVGETSRTVFADAAPPEFFQVALSYTDDTGAQRPVARWETIADPLAPTLIITWTESSDASGLSGYHVEWLTHVHDVEQIVAQEDVTNHRTAFFIAAEAQKYSVRVTARDIYGNETARTFGPFFVDYKTTPVYIGLDANAELPDPLYPDWTAAACNQAGTDTRVSEKALPGATLGTEQKLHTSWDADGLHLAWTGANWDYDGDLFIYLDTKPGGSVQAYNPFVTKVISDTYLPAYQDGSTTYRMGADYLVWIKTITDTALLAWDGSQWVGRASPWDFAFDFLERVPYTDIYLPFSSLDNPTTLSLVAFATEEKAFRLWAALPVENPLSSAQVVNTLPDENRPFLLTHCYAWDNLGSGVCPANRVVEGFPPLGVSLTASTAEPFPGETGEPAGLVYSLLGQNLPTTSADELTALSGWDVLLTPACLAQPESSACERKIETGTRVGYDQQYALAHLLGVNPPVLGQGRAVSYTLNLINNGSTTITDVVAHIDTWGPIRLTGGTQHSDAVGEYDTLEMPPVTLSAGEVITYTFAGYVDGAFDPANNNGWGTLNIVVLDRNGINTLDANGRDNYNFPIEWLYVDHKIDLQGPVYLEIENSTGVLTPGQNEISGLVIAQSSVPTITLVVTDSLNSMPKQTFVCPDDQPSNQEWMCPIDVTGIPETASVYISGQAINVYGMPSLWFQSGPFKIDTSLPEINFGSSTQIALSDGYINANELSWQGVASDTFSLDHAEICDPTIATDNCETVSLQITRVAEIANPTLTMDDKTEQPIGACNAPTTIPFDVAENKPVLDVDLGLNLTHPARDELQIVLVAPSGDAVTLYAGGTHQKNFDLNLDDAQAISVEQDMYAHRTGAPFFAFNRRPLELLYAFRNQMAQGQWQLHICDINPGENHGTYHRSRLLLTYRQYPKGTEGFWNYTVFGDTTDGEVITRTFTAVDGVGNRGNPRTAMFTLDVVAPSISVETITAVSNTITLKGTATDGTDIKTLWLDIFSPLGNLETHKLVLAGGEWAFVGAPTVDGAPDGVYRLFVRAEDNAGNLTRSEPYDLVLPGTLHVVEVTPLNLADNVSVKDPIRISFNGAMDTGSVTIIITPTLPLTPMWGADNMLLSLEHPMLAMKTPYTVTIQSGSGQNGDPLSNLPYRWHFTTTQNTLPTAVDDITQTNEDTPITIYVLDNDTDNETPGQLTVVAVGQPVSGTVINLGTNVQFDPDGAFEHLPPGLTTTESFTYTMTDGTDGFATALVTITISGINDRPQVDAGPDQVGFEGSAFLFDGHFSDPGKRPPPVGVHWDFGDGHAVTESISHTHTYQDNGIFTATLTITDAHGGVGMDTAVVTVDNVAPTVSVGPDQQGTVGEQLKFTGVLTDPGGMDTHSITWDFGDGQSITGTLTPTYRYNATGSFTITLTVVDDDGGKGVDQMVVNLDEDRKYLPLLLHNYSTLPDLIGELRLIPDKKHFVADEPVTLVVTVTNIGNSAADAFWVDLYINPDKPPIAANLSWDKTCTLSPCYGIAWGVLGLGAGESIVLTSVKDSYAEEYTYWENTFALGTTELYLYVDSWDLSHTYGAIQESNESNNRADLLGLHVISSRTYFPRVFPLVHEIR